MTDHLSPASAPPDDRDPANITDPANNFDDDDRLKPQFVRETLDLAEAGAVEAVRERVGRLHPADIADLFELAHADERPVLARVLGDLLSPDVLAEMNDYVREDLIDLLAPEQVAEIASELDTDDAVAIIEDMEADEQQAVLDALDPEDRAAIEVALSYGEETAGRLMQRDLVAIPEHVTVGNVIDMLREDGELTTNFWEIFVVDPFYHPIGTCQLSWILRSQRDVPISDVMRREQTLIPVDMDQEEVALRFQKYALISAAVIDTSGRLVGMITVDDIVHIIQEEAGEDVLRLSGAGEGDINQPIGETYRARVRWLIANLGTALIGTSIIYWFGSAIEKMVALAALMPMVASIGGNAGTQTMAVAVRALATNQLTPSNSMRVVGRELRVAVLNGATIALLVGALATLAFSDPMLGLVI
ncbi:MAG: hypothetical protein RLZZ58_1641, partial [Pseudomonadota bacterium]